MNAKREIKVPLSQAWREFRIRFVPVGVFICGLVAAVYLWSVTIVGPTMVGEVEAVQALVTTPQTGLLTNLLVNPFQLVKAGDPVAELIVTDVRASASRVQELRSQIAFSQLEINSVLDRERIAFDYQSLSMNTLRFRADLAGAQAELPTVEAALKRNKDALDAQVLPFNEYELSLRLRDSLKARIHELERLVNESEQRLQQAAHVTAAFTNVTTGVNLTDALTRLRDGRQHAETIQKEPIILRAPIDGIVGTFSRRAGENVMEGEPILTIHSLTGQRIVAYLRQGLINVPTNGTPVRVRCRTMKREEAMAAVEQVGFRYEPITNQSLLRPGMLFETGMPVGVTIPPELRAILKPGELVDLALEP